MKLLSTLTIAILATTIMSAQSSIAIDLAIVSVIEASIEHNDANKSVTKEEAVKAEVVKSNDLKICLDLDYLSNDSNTNEILVPETINDLEYAQEIAGLQENE